MGRRWGKTVLGGVLAAMVLARQGSVGWAAPAYKNSRPLWRFVERVFRPLAADGQVKINQAERTITTPGGGFLGVYSGDNPESILGESFNLLILDEAARLPEVAWEETCLPTLADADGDAILISTPKGKNWFYRSWMQAQADMQTQAAWTAPTSANPHPRIRKAFALAQERLPERIFRQEWRAEFIDSEGMVFRNVRLLATARPQERGIPGHRYHIGGDWGKSGDFSVFAVFDSTIQALVWIVRSNKVEYYVQRQRLRTLYDRFPGATVRIETNSIGEVNLEQLRREELLPDRTIAPAIPCQGTETTNAAKAAYVEAWALAFERQEIRIIPDPILILEHENFEYGRTATGLVKYGAPPGEHDDTVIASALAYLDGRRSRSVSTFRYQDAFLEEDRFGEAEELFKPL